MNTKAEIKQFILRALKRMDGAPMPDVSLIESVSTAVRDAAGKRPLVSDINASVRELELGGYIHGDEDELDKSVSWTLTPKGLHKAKQLG